MSERQLEQVEQDYAAYAPADGAKVTQVRQVWPNGADCAVCGEAGPTKRITWTLAHASLRYVQAMVCRNGVACRRRALEREAA